MRYRNEFNKSRRRNICMYIQLLQLNCVTNLCQRSTMFCFYLYDGPFDSILYYCFGCLLQPLVLFNIWQFTNFCPRVSFYRIQIYNYISMQVFCILKLLLRQYINARQAISTISIKKDLQCLNVSIQPTSYIFRQRSQ